MSAPRHTLPYVPLIAAGVGAFSFDQASKFWVSTQFPEWVSLNTGISFGIGESLPTGVVFVGLAGFLGVLIWSAKELGAKHPVPTGLLLGGAISNLIDRAVFGGVRDWLWLGGLRNNIADWAIGIGVFLILVQILREFFSRNTVK